MIQINAGKGLIFGAITMFLGLKTAIWDQQ